MRIPFLLRMTPTALPTDTPTLIMKYHNMKSFKGSLLKIKL